MTVLWNIPCRLVHLSFAHLCFFLCNFWYKIFDFFHEVRMSSESTSAAFFEKKSCSGVFEFKGPKMCFFKIYKKLTPRRFLFFASSYSRVNKLKWLLLEMCWLEVLGQTGPKIGLKWSFSSFMKNQCMKLQ